MTLPDEENRLFYSLYPVLMLYVNNQLKINANFKEPSQWTEIAPNERWDIREALFDHIEFIDEFVQTHSTVLTDEEIAIVLSWKHFVRDDFLLLKHLKKYSVFLRPRAEHVYGVVALVDPFEYFYPDPPVYLKTVLLPFKDKIIYDGLINFHRITFGGNMRRGFNEEYKKAKAQHGIIHRGDQLIMG